MKPREKVLIVEDDAGVAYLQRQRLERSGYSVLTASNCEEAVALARTGVDLIVLDYWLGNVTGLTVCEEFRAVGLDIPVVMVTGFSEEATVIEALRSGVRDFVPKTSQYLDYLPQAVERVLQQIRTERRLLELESRRRQGQKMEALGQLAGGVAHEFNNLLQIIQGFTEAALEESDDRPETREDLLEVLAATSRAANLTGQLLAFGRRQTMQMEALDLGNLIRGLMKMLRPLIGQNIEVRTQLEPNLGPVWGCGTMLGQVVMNLCLNARDAMAGGGRLTIQCSTVAFGPSSEQTHPSLPPGQYARLQVSDTGIGIAPEHLSRLYEPFFTTKPVGKGTGLGLATVFGVVEEHAGAIEVESVVGKGSSFSVYLPQTEVVAATRAVGPGARSAGDEMILIAEDEAGVRQYLEKVLSRAGYRVLTACDGEEAVDIFNQHQDEIALIVLDMVMPKLDGQGVWRTVQETHPHLRCVFISGYEPELDPSSIMSGEPPVILRKPVLRQDLLQAVRGLLDTPLAAPVAGF